MMVNIKDIVDGINITDILGAFCAAVSVTAMVLFTILWLIAR